MPEVERVPFIRQDLFKVPDSPGEKPYLRGSRCESCGRVFFPRRMICCDCKKEGTMKEIALSRKGKIVAGVTAHTAPVGFKQPYTMAFVDLPEGVRLFAQIKDEGNLKDYLVPGTERLKLGTEVELVIEKVREDDDGNDVIGPKFRPI